MGEQDTAAHFLQREPIPFGIGSLCFLSCFTKVKIKIKTLMVGLGPAAPRLF